jgi:hypothetical protein
VIAIDQSVKNIGCAENVFDDFPDVVPVTSRELDVIETYMRGLLDEASTGSEIGGELLKASLLEQRNEEKVLASVRSAAKMNIDKFED